MNPKKGQIAKIQKDKNEHAATGRRAGKERQQNSSTGVRLQRGNRMALPHTSLSAHIRAMEPMLLVMVIKVALARSSLLTDSLFSLLIMFPKLSRKF